MYVCVYVCVYMCIYVSVSNIIIQNGAGARYPTKSGAVGFCLHPMQKLCFMEWGKASGAKIVGVVCLGACFCGN
jgi:hypothetical protein